jgi:hypothetical protein
MDFYAVMVFAQSFGVGFVVADYAAFFVAVQPLIYKDRYDCGG